MVVVVLEVVDGVENLILYAEPVLKFGCGYYRQSRGFKKSWVGKNAQLPTPHQSTNRSTVLSTACFIDELTVFPLSYQARKFVDH